MLYRRLFVVTLHTGESETCSITPSGVCVDTRGNEFGQLGTTVREIVALTQRDVIQVK